MSTADYYDTPLYDAAIAALEAAATAAEHTLENETVTIEECVEVTRAFEAAERSFNALRLRAEHRGWKLCRNMLRDAGAER